jgi:hypothetical protein
MAHEQDKALILRLGGPKAVAERLGYEGQGGVQRVINWMNRDSGIPAAVKLQYPNLFLADLTKKLKARG